MIPGCAAQWHGPVGRVAGGGSACQPQHQTWQLEGPRPGVPRHKVPQPEWEATHFERQGAHKDRDPTPRIPLKLALGGAALPRQPTQSAGRPASTESAPSRSLAVCSSALLRAHTGMPVQCQWSRGAEQPDSEAASASIT